MIITILIVIIITIMIIIIIIIGGNTWDQTIAPYGDWYSITSDSTGQYLAAVQLDGYVYTSTSG